MSQTPGSNDAFNDSLNFVKKLWGGMHVPGMGGNSGSPVGNLGNMQTLQGMALPSMSVEDLDKRIQDLKTVETWLNVNMTMLRSTIQALEVQRATIATLHSLSSTMADTMKGMGAGAANNPFASYMAQANAGAETEPPADAAAPAATVEAGSESSSDATKTEKATEVSPLISQSAAWWSGVQEQFKQALGTALEKSAANYDAIKSVSETVAKNSASQFKAAAKPKAPAKASPKTPAKVATRAAKTTKAATKTPAKAVRKAPVGSAAKAKTVAAPVRRAAK